MGTPLSEVLTANLPAQLAGERLDKAIAAVFDDVSRGEARQLIGRGAVRVDGRRIRIASRPVPAGAKLEVGRSDAVASAQAQVAPIEVVERLPGAWVIHKPAGVHVQGTAFGNVGTVEDQVKAALRKHPREDPYVGIVHRLDADTSGLMVVAVSKDEAHSLGTQIRAHEVRREYLALVDGVPDRASGIVDAPLTKRVRGRVRIAGPGDGKPAVTHWERLAVEPKKGWSLLRCELETGRQHQIRVHLAYAVAPVLGDRLYGPRRSEGRLALHATRLCFRHTERGEQEFVALPDAEYYCGWSDGEGTAESRFGGNGATDGAGVASGGASG